MPQKPSFFIQSGLLLYNCLARQRSAAADFDQGRRRPCNPLANRKRPFAMFDDAAKILSERESENNRDQYAEHEIKSLLDSYSGIPRDYLAYLREIGGGSFLNCRYTVYGGFYSPDFYWGDGTEEALGKRVLCFGDDFSGYVAAFLPDEEWAVVELNKSGTELDYLDITFNQFVRQKLDIEG